MNSALLKSRTIILIAMFFYKEQKFQWSRSDVNEFDCRVLSQKKKIKKILDENNL